MKRRDEIYKRHVEYRFELNGDDYAIRPFQDESTECLEIEETRKNGQEDCHMSGLLSKDADGKWQWDEGSDSFETYGDTGLSDDIVQFLNQNPPPTL
jgi:hypothetical protein